MTRYFKFLLCFTILATVWFIASSNYVWQFPIHRTIFITLGHGAVTVAKLNIPEEATWRFLGFNSAGWDWSWDFQNYSVIDIWRIRLPLWPVIVALIALSIWSWYRLVFRRPYLCLKCAFDLRGTISNPARLCNECGTPWNSEFLAAQADAAATTWSGPTYPLLRRTAIRRFFVFIAVCIVALGATMLLFSSYASPQEVVLGNTELNFSRFVFWITRTIDNTRLLDSGLTIPSTARQIITSFQTMPNGSFLISIPLWPFIAAIAALLWLTHKRWLTAHRTLWAR